MDEQRVGVADVAVRAIGHDRPRPCRPGCCGQLMGWRSDAEQIQDHQLAIVVPPRVEESTLVFPSHREQMRMAVQHPVEVDAFVQRTCGPHDPFVVLEGLADGQHTGHEECGIDRRHFAAPLAATGPPVDEVIEPAVMMRQVSAANSRSRGRAPPPRARQPASRSATDKRRQSEARCCHARDVLLRMERPVGSGAVQHLARAWVAVVPEVLERATLEVLEPGMIVGRERSSDARTRGPPPEYAGTVSSDPREELAPVETIGSHRSVGHEAGLYVDVRRGGRPAATRDSPRTLR